MNVLLLGSSGQLGTSLKKTCPSFINFQYKSKEDLNIVNFKLLKETILDTKPDYIINTAAYTKVDEAEKNVELANNTNCTAVHNLAKIAKKIDSFLIHFSTDYVFDGKKNNSYNEYDIPNPISVYGKSKLLGEVKISSTIEKYFIFRISWLFGGQDNNFIYKMLNFINHNKTIKIVSDQRGIPTCANELSKNLWHILNDNELKNKVGLYHYCGRGETTTWYDMALFISEYLVKKGFNFPKIYPCKTLDYKFKALRPMNSCFNTSKINNTFSLQQDSWKNNIKRVIDNYIINKENK